MDVGQCRLLKNFFDVHAGGKAGLTKAVDDKNWEMATRTNQLFFKAMKSLRSVASRSALPTNMDLKKRIAYTGKLLWASLRTHAFLSEVVRKTVFQTEAYQSTVMQHVVENFMSLSRFDNLKAKTQDYDNRLNRLEQHCKLTRAGKPKELK